MDQLDILSITKPELSEAKAFELIRPNLESVLEKNNIDFKTLSISKKKGFSSITFTTYLLARLCLRTGKSHFSIQASYRSLLPDNAYISIDPKDNKFINVQLSSATEITHYADFFASTLQLLIDRLPKDFDCCSRYQECSDAGMCVNPQKDVAIGCGYKKVLRSGRVFYGKNRNID